MRTLVTMKKLTTAQSMMDKLGPVREVIVQKDDAWEEWGVEQLVNNLRKYVERNPLRTSDDDGKRDNTLGHHPGRKEREKLLLGNSEGPKPTRPNRKFTCVYCNSDEHFSNNCMRVLDLAARRAILQRNKMCYNCTAVGHRATQCRGDAKTAKESITLQFVTRRNQQ